MLFSSRKWKIFCEVICNKQLKRCNATEAGNLLCGLSEAEDFHELFTLDSDGSDNDFLSLS